MKNKAWAFAKNHPAILVLSVIFLLGTFLRTYHLGDWLHFELDQSRDAKVIDLALTDGIQNLPLLGPKAAGSFLRLGPIFYYFEYLSAKIFGSTPPGMVALCWILSCLTIPTLYFFLRRKFEEKLSLLLTLIFSLSLFFILYSRFGWNPNNLPFFVILAFLALLKACDQEEKKRGVWLLILSLSATIATQLHFLAFLAVPTITFLFLAIKRPRVHWKYWLGSLFIILFLYSPVILNELKTGGDNLGEFQKVFLKKSDSESERTLLEKVYKNYTSESLGYVLLLSSQEQGEVPKINQKGAFSFDIICASDCQEGKTLGKISLVFFTLGIFLLVFRIYRSLFQKSSPEKDFLILSGIWFLVSFILFHPIAYDISPRFFLLISGLPFVFLGLVLELFLEKIRNKKIAWGIVSLLIVILAIANLRAIQKRFQELSLAPYKNFKINPDRILKEKNRVTLAQQKLITDYILAIHSQNNFPIYLNSDPQYRRSFLYHLDKKEIPRDDFRNASNSGKIYSEGNYFLIYSTSANWENKTGKYLNDFNVLEKKPFGTLTIWRLTPKAESINALRQEFEPKGKPKSAPGVPVRYRWEEIFTDTENDEKEISE